MSSVAFCTLNAGLVLLSAVGANRSSTAVVANCSSSSVVSNCVLGRNIQDHMHIQCNIDVRAQIVVSITCAQVLIVLALSLQSRRLITLLSGSPVIFNTN